MILRKCRRAESKLGKLGMVIFMALGVLIAVAPAAGAAKPLVRHQRLLTLAEGQAIVNAAWKRERRVRTKPDCSHLVHEIYNWAGFEYEYANSFELYEGSESFLQVLMPQPGDLIVWQGHVGIVIDAEEQSFYSSISEGARTAYYDSLYWQRRYRTPRFYRYVADNDVRVASSSSSVNLEPKASQPDPIAATVAADNKRLAAKRARPRSCPSGWVRAPDRSGFICTTPDNTKPSGENGATDSEGDAPS